MGGQTLKKKSGGSIGMGYRVAHAPYYMLSLYSLLLQWYAIPLTCASPVVATVAFNCPILTLFAAAHTRCDGGSSSFNLILLRACRR